MKLEKPQQFLSDNHDAIGQLLRNCNDCDSSLRSDCTAQAQQNVIEQANVANTVLIRCARLNDNPADVVQKIVNIVNVNGIAEKNRFH